MKALKLTLIFKALITVAALGFLATGCGEDYNALYTGEGTLSGCGAEANDDGANFIVTVNASVNGNTLNLQMVDLRSKSPTNNIPPAVIWMRQNSNISAGLSNGRDFLVSNKLPNNLNSGTITSSGSIDGNREFISNYMVTLSNVPFTKAGTGGTAQGTCQMVFTGTTTLELQK